MSEHIREYVTKLATNPGISPEFTCVSVRDAALLLSELDKVRTALNGIHSEAGKRIEERLRGWERWQKVYDWAAEALK